MASFRLLVLILSISLSFFFSSCSANTDDYVFYTTLANENANLYSLNLRTNATTLLYSKAFDGDYPSNLFADEQYVYFISHYSIARVDYSSGTVELNWYQMSTAWGAMIVSYYDSIDRQFYFQTGDYNLRVLEVDTGIISNIGFYEYNGVPLRGLAMYNSNGLKYLYMVVDIQDDCSGVVKLDLNSRLYFNVTQDVYCNLDGASHAVVFSNFLFVADSQGINYKINALTDILIQKAFQSGNEFAFGVDNILGQIFYAVYAGPSETSLVRMDPNTMEEVAFAIVPSDVFSATFVKADMVPTLTKITPSYGPVSSYTTTYIAGSYFLDQPTLSCKFGAVAVNATFYSNSLISCVAPPTPIPGSSPVTVTNDGLDYSLPVYFLYQ